MQSFFRCAILLTSTAVMASCSSAGSHTASVPMNGPLPLKFAGGPTKPELSARDLMTRLYQYADDTMEGRGAGFRGNVKATAYIASEFRRLGLQPAGDSGGYLQNMHYDKGTEPAYNVVAILPGSDPVLRHQYIAISAHNDHEAKANLATSDHDSLRAVMLVKGHKSWRVRRFLPPGLTEEQRAEKLRQMEDVALRALLDTLRRRNPVPRYDSLMNGADDNGSGTVGLLELAEAFANARVKPKRSILFVSQTAEERGLLGSAYYAKYPTVPRDSIVANINIDMIGRGTVDDLQQGGPLHLDVVGPRRTSSDLEALVEAVNAKQKRPFKFDYRYDTLGHKERIFCRSDHWSYAKYGIPSVFFYTGTHMDAHEVTDEPQYVDYDKLWRVTTLVYDLTTQLGNLPKRPVYDKPKVADPDNFPRSECK